MSTKLQRTICVSSCPSWVDPADKPAKLPCKHNDFTKSCLPNDSTDPEQKVVIYNTTTFVSRVCIPVDNTLYNLIKGYINPETVEEWWADLLTSWYVIIGAALFALLMAFTWMFLVKYCAGFIVWACIITYFMVLGFGAYFFYT